MFIDTNNRIKMKKVPTQNYQEQIKDVTKHASFICEGKKQTYKIINMNPKPPMMNGLPKIHTTDISNIPIANYKIAQGYVSQKISHYNGRKNQFTYSVRKV